VLAAVQGDLRRLVLKQTPSPRNAKRASLNA
jgi:hypothetical protein